MSKPTQASITAATTGSRAAAVCIRRTRLQSGIVDPWGPPLIAADRLTIAGLAKRHGYRTACVGKWHLGWDWPIPKEQAALFKGTKEDVPATDEHRGAWQTAFSQAIGGGPTTRGFDLYFGTDVPNWPPFCFIENDRTVGIPGEFLPARLLRDNQASVPGPALAGWTLEPILPALADRAAAFIAAAAAARRARRDRRRGSPRETGDRAHAGKIRAPHCPPGPGID